MSKEDLKKEVEKVSLTVIKAERGEPILHVYGQASPAAVVATLGKVLVDYYNEGGTEAASAVLGMCHAIIDESHSKEKRDAFIRFCMADDDSEGGLLSEE